jgi:hypothetical protein
MGSVLVFSHFDFDFLFDKPLARVPHAPASGRRLRHSSGACDATRWLNLAIRRLPGCAAEINFSFFSFLKAKMYNCPLCLLFFNFSPHS